VCDGRREFANTGQSLRLQQLLLQLFDSTLQFGDIGGAFMRRRSRHMI